MTDTIERVTLENAADQLKAKIRMAFVELLPDEQWKEMVAAELRRFTQPGEARDQYVHQRVTPPSTFSQICSEVFTEHMKDQIKTVLSSQEWKGKWGINGSEEISQAVGAWLTANSPALIQATIQSLAGHAAQQLVSMMRHAP